MAHENAAEVRVRTFLEERAFDVKRVPRLQAQRRADYIATYAQETYIIEVKGRTGDDQFWQDLQKEGWAFREDPIGRTNPISRRVRHAAEQLEKTPAEPTAFRVIAFVLTEDDPNVQLEQIESTLYGKVPLIMPAEDGSPEEMPCYYFTFNELYVLTMVDAALILSPAGSRALLNSFSPHASDFRRARLWQLHADEGAICDPSQLEAQGEAFLADCDVDRRDERKMRNYIRRKYKLEGLPTHLPIVGHPTRRAVGRRIRSETMIAFCGVTCTDCPAYIATQAGDREAMEQVLAHWRADFNVPHITLEDVTCDGCLTEGGRLSGYCADFCKVRPCALARGVPNCAHCAEYPCANLQRLLEVCDDVEGFFAFVRRARATLLQAAAAK